MASWIHSTNPTMEAKETMEATATASAFDRRAKAL
jgi:hypothetical protein